jgi:predicted regulator of Ras-like GTPase activity (Roadblock/LC7/MglB family)
VDAAQAIADLTEISSQIESVVVADSDGTILGSNLDGAGRAERVAEGVARLLEEAASAAPGREGFDLAQLEAAMPEGSVFVVREGGRTIAATTSPEPTVGLVFYDLKSCLRTLAEEPKAKPAPRKRAPRKPKADDGAS